MLFFVYDLKFRIYLKFVVLQFGICRLYWWVTPVTRFNPDDFESGWATIWGRFLGELSLRFFLVPRLSFLLKFMIQLKFHRDDSGNVKGLTLVKDGGV